MERPWLKSYPQGVRPQVTYPVAPAYHHLYEQIQRHPGRTALIFYGKRTSYRELGQQIDRFAAALVRKLGIRPGDRVGIILPNCPQNVIATVAAQRVGAIPVQFNPMYVAREIAHQLHDSGCRVLITLDLFWPKVQEAGVVDRYIVTGVPDALPFPLNLLFPLKQKAPPVPPGAAIRFTDMLRESAEGFQPAPVEPNTDPAVLIYTGGTTGVSKGVVLTHANLNANIGQIMEFLQPGDRHHTVLAVLPMFHSYGYTAAVGFALASGATAVLVPKFDAREVLKLIQKHRVTTLPGVPTIYTALLKDPELNKFDLTSIEFCVSGAAPLPLELLKRFESITGAKILEGFGLTECSPVTHQNPLNGKRVPGSVGLPYPDTEVRIIDMNTGADLPIGQEGELLIRGPQVMKGYWNRPEETAAVLKDGWLYTGDIGRMDEEGYLYIVDRIKDMIIAGGFNIYPREIDEVLYAHPAVLEACAVGIADEYRGETVKAFVVLKPGAAATEQEILEHCKGQLAAYKRPHSVEFMPELPKSLVGKVLRRVLVEREKAKADGVREGVG